MTAPTLPVPAALCAGYIGASRMRATLVDACGRPVYGPNSQVVSSGFVSVELAPEVEDGDDYSAKNAAGELCINDRGPDNVKYIALNFEFCQVDPALYVMLNRTWKTVTDASRRTATGFRIGQQVSNTLGYALELWPKVTGPGAGQACLTGDPNDPTFQVCGYFLLPYCIALGMDSLTVENNPMSFKLKGKTKPGSLWGHGPYNVTRDIDGMPAPLLDPIDPGFDWPAIDLVSSDPDHFHGELVTVAPPVTTCGGRPLWNPSATAPQLAAAPTVGDTLSATLTVSNFALVGNAGTVDWGDGTIAAMLAATVGVASHAYAADQAGIEQTITFTPGNGATPVSTTFTPAASGLEQPDTAADTAADSSSEASPAGPSGGAKPGGDTGGKGGGRRRTG
jgi:hypothetical protein